MTPVRDRYAVIGNPIEHSKSPWIHARFAEQTGEPVEYGRIARRRSTRFERDVRAFIEAGGRGLNVTVPFKLDAHAFADSLVAARGGGGRGEHAARSMPNGVYGDNTDGVGLVRDIEVNLGVSLEGRAHSAARRGRRGARRRAADARARAGGADHRQPHGGEGAAAGRSVRARPRATRACACRAAARDAIEAGPYDVIVNATAGSLDAVAARVRRQRVRQRHARLRHDVRRAADRLHASTRKQLGARGVDGLGMLVEQAAESFYVWRGVRPDGGAGAGANCARC